MRRAFPLVLILLSLALGGCTGTNNASQPWIAPELRVGDVWLVEWRDKKESFTVQAPEVLPLPWGARETYILQSVHRGMVVDVETGIVLGQNTEDSNLWLGDPGAFTGFTTASPNPLLDWAFLSIPTGYSSQQRTLQHTTYELSEKGAGLLMASTGKWILDGEKLETPLNPHSRWLSHGDGWKVTAPGSEEPVLRFILQQRGTGPAIPAVASNMPSLHEILHPVTHVAPSEFFGDSWDRFAPLDALEHLAEEEGLGSMDDVDEEALILRAGYEKWPRLTDLSRLPPTHREKGEAWQFLVCLSGRQTINATVTRTEHATGGEVDVEVSERREEECQPSSISPPETSLDQVISHVQVLANVNKIDLYLESYHGVPAVSIRATPGAVHQSYGDEIRPGATRYYVLLAGPEPTDDLLPQQADYLNLNLGMDAWEFNAMMSRVS